MCYSSRLQTCLLLVVYVLGIKSMPSVSGQFVCLYAISFQNVGLFVCLFVCLFFVVKSAVEWLPDFSLWGWLFSICVVLLENSC